MIYRIRHTTTYQYEEPVSLCHNLARLTPRDGAHQACLHSELQIDPEPDVSSRWTDYFGNAATFFTIQQPHQELVVTAVHAAHLKSFTPPTATDSPAWEEVRDTLPGDRSPAGMEAYQFVFDSPYVRASADLGKYAAESFPSARPLLEGVLDLSRRIHSEFKYDQRATTISTPLAEVLAERHGVCQDFAHLAIGCLRSLGLPARYVSGYLSTTPPPGQPRVVGADASHAWFSVYCPRQGWVDVDPTNNQVPSDRHIVLAWGRDFDDVSPIKGVILGGGQHTVTVAVDVIPDEKLSANHDSPG
jgi:transglutaminase-like putative cysteine protease